MTRANLADAVSAWWLRPDLFDPCGQYYNGLSRRAMVVRADGSARREDGGAS